MVVSFIPNKEEHTLMTTQNKLASFPNINILNPKALERQLKVLDTHINELQGQIDELQKMRSACLILLGAAPQPQEVTAPQAASETKETSDKPKKSEDLAPKIVDLLKQREVGMTADEIFDCLKEGGVSISGKRPVAAVYSALEKHPELFRQDEAGVWVETQNAASPDAMN
jgi:hypothetical protein